MDLNRWLLRWVTRFLVVAIPVALGYQTLRAQSPNPLLYTILDNRTSVFMPVFGDGSHAVLFTVPTDDFVDGMIGSGLHADAHLERAAYPQIDSSGVPNIELERGTIEFWYRPAYNWNDSVKHTITGTGNWAAPGSMHLGKHNQSNQNSIYLILNNGSGVRFEHNVVVSAYSWMAGDWVLFRLTWDFNVALGVPNLHLYLNGVELPLSGQTSWGPQPMPAEQPTQFLYIGSRGSLGCCPAKGVYDEFRIWNVVLAP